MKGSLIITAFFITGILLGVFHLLPEGLKVDNLSLYSLYALLLFVGIGIGSDKESLSALKRMRGWLVLIPVVIVVGALAGSLVAWLILDDYQLNEILAVGSGMGYYSLSSIMISEVKGETLGTIALISNLAREFITLLAAPLLIKVFGKFAPIAAGGATAMDTTLPVVIRFSGKDFTIVSIYSGVVITFLVPFLVGIFIK